MNAFEISVVMSVYNSADTLPAALKSILSQQGVSLEFIVIDDGSTDGSGEILDRVAEKDSRLRVVHKKNEGLTQALIDGCAMASAPWIARQDADDISLPGRLRAQLNRAKRPDNPVLIGCGVRVLTEEGDVLETLLPPVDIEMAREHILEKGAAISHHGSILFNREAYEKTGGYRPQFYYAQDIDLTTRLAEFGPVSAVDSVFYEYCFSPFAISGRYGPFQLEFYRLISKGVELRRQGQSDQSISDQVEAVRKKCIEAKGKKKDDLFGGLYFIGSRLSRVNPERACLYFKRALKIRPFSLKAIVRFVCAKCLQRRKEVAISETSAI